MTFTYNTNEDGALLYITDVYGRKIHFQYDTSCRVSRIYEESTNLKGRDVEFTYDSDNRLETIRTAKVLTDGGIGNQFTNGKTWKFTYPKAIGVLELDTNIESIIAPNENAASSTTPYVTNTYGTSSGTTEYDRVTSQVWGGTNASGRNAGGTVSYSYDFSDPPAPKNTVTDRNGNETLYVFTPCYCHVAQVTERTNRNIRSGEGNYTTSLTYNSDGEILTITYPEGNSVTNVYDIGNTNRSAHGNLLSTTRSAGPRGGDGSGSTINNITYSYTYEPIFQGIRTATSARGNDSSFTPPESALNIRAIDFELAGTAVTNQKARYTSLTLYDYQEGAKGDIQTLAAAEKIVVTLTQADVLALENDQNQDGLTNQQFGLPVESCQPNTQTWSADFTTRNSQSIVSNYRYNSFGLLIATISPEGYLTEYQYGPSADPDGTTASTATGGYPLKVIADKSTAIRTPAQTTARTQITTETQRDKVGNVVTSIDGRGISHTAIVNELNQTQVTVQAASAPAGITALSYTSRMFYDANNNVVKSEKENKAPSAYGSPATLVATNPWFTTTMEYDILNNLISQTSEVQSGPTETVTLLGETFTIGRATSSTFNNTVTRRFFHDRNQHVVLAQSPLSVSGAEANNVSSSIFDERDLPYKSSQGGIDSSFSSAVPLPTSVSLPSGVSNTSLTGTYTTNYDGNKNSVESIDAEDNGSAGADMSTVIYDGFDRVVKSIDAFGNDSTTDYDPDSQPVEQAAYGPDGGNKAATPANRKLLTSGRSNYDEIGRNFKSEADLFNTPGGSITDTYETKPRFDRESRVIAGQDARGNISEAEFDGLGRTIESTDAMGNFAEMIYDENSNLLQSRRSETEGGSTQVYYHDFHYDAVNRQILSVDTLGNTRRSYFDSRGLTVASTDANSSSSASIDVEDRGGSTSVTGNSDGNRVFYLHDAAGQQIEIVRELRVDNDGANAIDTSNSFNSDGKIITKTFYDDSSRVTSRQDDKLNATSYSYDVRNRKTSETFADSTSRSWQYDRDSHMTQFADQRGVVTTISPTADMDELGRVKKISYTLVSGVLGTTEQRFEFDGLSRVTKCEDDKSGSADDTATVCSFDSLSRCISEVQTLNSASGTVSKTYDENSNMETLTYPGTLSGTGTDIASYVYDDLNRITTVKWNSINQATYSFAGPGRISSSVIYTDNSAGNPINSAMTFDEIGRIRQITHSNLVNPDSSSTFFQFLYAFDRENNMLCEQNFLELLPGRGRDFYYYDSASRMTREIRDIPASVAKTGVSFNQAGNPTTVPTTFGDDRQWKLDGVSNRVEQTDQVSGSPAVTFSRSTNTVNEYNVSNGTSRSHDDNGNLIDDGTYLYHFDALNRLVQVNNKSSGLVITKNTYDAKQRRVRHVVTNSGSLNEDLRFYHLGSREIAEHDSSNNATRQFMIGGMGERFKMRQMTGGSLEQISYVSKLNGSVAGHVDDSRELLAVYDYRVQGVVDQQAVGTDNKWFTSDDSSTTIMKSRGRFFSQERRHDLEHGLIAQDDSTRFVDPVNWRKISPSNDQWVQSLWGLRYNALTGQETKCFMQNFSFYLSQLKRTFGKASDRGKQITDLLDSYKKGGQIKFEESTSDTPVGVWKPGGIFHKPYIVFYADCGEQVQKGVKQIKSGKLKKPKEWIICGRCMILYTKFVETMGHEAVHALKENVSNSLDQELDGRIAGSQALISLGITDTKLTGTNVQDGIKKVKEEYEDLKRDKNYTPVGGSSFDELYDFLNGEGYRPPWTR